MSVKIFLNLSIMLNVTVSHCIVSVMHTKKIESSNKTMILISKNIFDNIWRQETDNQKVMKTFWKI